MRDTHVRPRATWLRLFHEAGLAALIDTRICEGVSYDTFVAVREASPLWNP